MIQLTIGTGSCPSQRGHDDYPDAAADRPPFHRAELLAFVAAAWPLMEDDPDVPLWAGEFIEVGLAGATV